MSLDALGLLYDHLTSSARLVDLVSIFGHLREALSRCFKDMVKHIYRHWSFLLHCNPEWLTPSRLESFAALILAAGAPLGDIWAFIDGTICLICRPSSDEDVVYNGHAGDYALKYQGVTLPDGMIQNLFGPMEGKRADSGILDYSGFIEMCLEHAKARDGWCLFIYGYTAYPMNDIVISDARQLNKQSPELQEFNI